MKKLERLKVELEDILIQPIIEKALPQIELEDLLEKHQEKLKKFVATNYSKIKHIVDTFNLFLIEQETKKSLENKKRRLN